MLYRQKAGHKAIAQHGGKGGHPLPRPQGHPGSIVPISPRRIGRIPMPGKKFTAKEDAFIRENHRFKTAQEMAYRLGRSRSGVYGRMEALGLTEEGDTAMSNVSVIRGGIEAGRKAYPDGWLLKEFERLKEALDEAIKAAPVTVLPRLVGESREVLNEIDRLQKEGAATRGTTPLDEIRRLNEKGPQRIRPGGRRTG